METILDKYFDDIKGVFPFWRLVLFVYSILVSTICHSAVNGSVLRAVLSLKVDDLLSLEGGIWSTLMLADVMFGALIVISSSLLFSLMSKLIFRFISDGIQLAKMVDAEYQKYSKIPQMEQAIVVASIDYAKGELEKRVARARGISRVSELLLGIGVLMFVVSFYSGSFDLVVSILSFLFWFIAQSASMIFYLKKVLPMDLHLGALIGRRIQIELPA